MMFKSKKGQVDVAITIGAIIIPFAAIFGSLVFAWATLGPLTDAAAVASLITHDVAGISEVAYAVPDNIKIKYVPPSICKFGKDSLNQPIMTCFDENMNITSFYLTLETQDVRSPLGVIKTPMRTNSVAYIYIDPEYLDEDQALPIMMPFPGFADFRDRDLIDSPMRSLEMTSSYLEISKEKTDLYNSLAKSPDGENPLKELMQNALDLCKTAQRDIIAGHDPSAQKAVTITLLPGSKVDRHHLGRDEDPYIYDAKDQYLTFSQTAYSPDFSEGTADDHFKYDLLSVSTNKFPCFVALKNGEGIEYSGDDKVAVKMTVESTSTYLSDSGNPRIQAPVPPVIILLEEVKS